MKKFIGENQILSVFEAEDGFVKVSFDEHPEITIKKELLEALSSKTKGKGKNVQDQINHVFALKFLTELADNGLDIYTAHGIAYAMQTLSKNLRDETVSKRFKVTSPDLIRIKDIL